MTSDQDTALPAKATTRPVEEMASWLLMVNHLFYYCFSSHVPCTVATVPREPRPLGRRSLLPCNWIGAVASTDGRSEDPSYFDTSDDDANLGLYCRLASGLQPSFWSRKLRTLLARVSSHMATPPSPPTQIGRHLLPSELGDLEVTARNVPYAIVASHDPCRHLSNCPVMAPRKHRLTRSVRASTDATLMGAT